MLDPYYAKKEVSEPPYEVSHTGWGEFDLEIKIVFRIRAMRTLTLNHYLRLVEYIPDTGDFIYTNSVRSEHYDEIVFSRPPEKLRIALELSENQINSAAQPGQSERRTDARRDNDARRNQKDDEYSYRRALSLQSIRIARQVTSFAKVSEVYLLTKFRRLISSASFVAYRESGARSSS